MSLILLLLSIWCNAAWEQAGRLDLGAANYFQKLPKEPALSQTSGTYFLLTPELQWSAENSRVKLKGVLEFDRTYPTSKEQSVAFPQEAFFEFRRNHFGLSVGQNIITWGITDVVNPLDPINSRNYRQILNPTKIGAAGITLNFNHDHFSWDLVYIPSQTRPFLPPTSSRTLPRDATFSNFVAEGIEGEVQVRTPNEALNFEYLADEDISSPFKDNVGSRVKFSLGRLETQLIYFEGAPGFPEIKIASTNTTVVQLPPPVTILELQPLIQLTPRYHRIRTAGGGFSLPVGSNIFKFVHSRVWSTDNLIQISQPQTTILALEKSLSLFKMESNLLFQYMTQSDPGAKGNSVFSSREVFDNSILIGFRTSSSDLSWNFSLGQLNNLKGNGQLTQLELRKKITDTWAAYFQAQNMNGREGSLLGSLKYSSRADIGLTAIW